MQIEIGKSYKRRDGKMSTVIEVRGHIFSYRYRVQGDGTVYTVNGGGYQYHGGTSDGDLVAPWPDTTELQGNVMKEETVTDTEIDSTDMLRLKLNAAIQALEQAVEYHNTIGTHGRAKGLGFCIAAAGLAHSIGVKTLASIKKDQ